MTLLDLVATLRHRLDDLGGDVGFVPTGYTYYWECDDSRCLWSNTALTSLLDVAQDEFCRRQPLLGYIRLNMTAGTADYALSEGSNGIDASILSIQAIHRLTTGQLVRKIDNRHMDPAVDYPPVSVYQEDAPILNNYPSSPIIKGRTLRILGTPEADETLVLTVERLPTVLYHFDWEDGKDAEPEIDGQFHWLLVEYAAHLAYLKRDFDTYNPAFAAQALAFFDRAIGPPQSAADLEWRRRKANTRPRALAQFL